MNKENIEDILGLTPMQEGMLFHYLKNPESESYHEQLRLEIIGNIDLKCFVAAWHFVIESNEMLRTLFQWENMANPVQVVLKEHKLQIEYTDFSHRHSSKKKKGVEEITQSDRRKGFNLNQVPFRVILCKIEEEKYQMFISSHHILYDGWSNGIILREFFNAYSESVNWNRFLKPPVKTKFKEFVKWCQNRDFEGEEKFWRNYLKGVEVHTKLSIKRKRSVKSLYAAGSIRTALAADVRSRWQAFAKECPLTLGALLYTGWGILLQKYNNCDDVIFGTTVSGRSAKVEGIENIVGLFINTLPMRVQTMPNEKTRDLLYRMDSELKTRANYEHTSLVNIKQYSETGNKKKLFDSIMVLENYPLDVELKQKRRNGELSVNSYSMLEMTHYDLTIGISLFDRLECTFIYRKGVLDQEAVRRLAAHFKHIVEDMMDNPGKRVQDIEILMEEEKRQVLFDFNNTAADYPHGKTIHQCFKEQVIRAPDRTAVVGISQLAVDSEEKNGKWLQITYGELNKKSGLVAEVLRVNGVNPGNIVGIMVERFVEVIIGILGILKAGAAYLPVDPDYPPGRVYYMLKDCGVKVLLAASLARVRVEENHEQPHEFPRQIINLESSLFSAPWVLPSASPLTCQDSRAILAYVIYTSGSTGKPKGVLVEHSSVINLVLFQEKYFNIDENERILQFSSICFDASVEQIFLALFSGSVLVLIVKDILLDNVKFEEFISKYLVTHLHSVPSFLDNMGLEKKFGLKRIISGGDMCPVSLAKRWYKVCRFYNEYGPTEATVTSIEMMVDELDETRVRLPIGKPIANTFIYLLDRYFKVVPLGVAGEMYIGGEAVARGYVNRPELAAAKFEHDVGDYRDYHDEDHKLLRGGPNASRGGFLEKSPPGRRKQRIYKTGDLGRWLSNGTVEFLGRADQQIKIRGYRIEPGEIQHQLLIQPKIKDAVVMPVEMEGEKYVCAYIAAKKSIKIPRLKETLSRCLPAYMIPTYFVQLPGIPFTATGKVDRSALPKPGMGREKEYAVPRDETEAKLAALWEEVLGVKPLGIHDNFFDVGGHSLSTLRVISGVRNVFRVELSIREVFRFPTIAGMSCLIREHPLKHFVDIKPQLRQPYYELSYSQKRLWFIHRQQPGSSYNMSGRMTLYNAVDVKLVKEVFKQLTDRHESLRTSFKEVDKNPVQVIAAVDSLDWHIKTVDLSHMNEWDRDTGRNRLLLEESGHIFDLTVPPLFRVKLVKCRNREFDLIFNVHHIISDGWSIEVLKQEFKLLYKNQREGKNRDLEPLTVQYKDYAAWHNCLLADEARVSRAKTFWKRQLKSGLPVLDLPYDVPPSPSPSKKSAAYCRVIPGVLTGKLREMGRRYRASLFMVLLAGFNLVLSRVTGETNIVIALAAAAREHESLENVIGMFVNTLILRTTVTPKENFQDFFKRLRTNIFQVLEYQDFPMELVFSELNLKYPKIPVFLNMINIGNPLQEHMENFESCHIQEVQEAKFDVVCYIKEYHNGIEISCHYFKALFMRETIEKIMDLYVKVLENISNEPAMKIEEYGFSGKRRKLTPAQV